MPSTSLWTKTANSRRGVLILTTLLVYVVWCDYAYEYTTGMLDSKLTGDSPSTICGESFNDTRIYIQGRARHDWGNLPIIYFITPTHPHREQVPELTRLAYTLLHVPRLHWIVANDHNVCNSYLDILLQRFGIPYTHLASPMPDRFRKAGIRPYGVANRNAAVQWLRQHNITTGVLYFGDDDNTYDLKLFSEIRDTKHVSMFPVGLIGDFGISGPVVRKGKVIGLLDSWVGGRHWPVDMAGFAVSLSYMAEYPNESMPFKPGYEEDLFLRSIGLNLDMIEPKANNCTEVLVWHTQTRTYHESTKGKIDHEYLDERSNLGVLFKALTEMGVSSAADDEDMLDSILIDDSPFTICGESFNDTRIYIQDRARHDWGNLSIIYFITPTYPHREQVPELTRLAYTLLHVPRLHWIVANDHNGCNSYLDILLRRFGIPYTHLASPMPDSFRKAGIRPYGVANRNAAVQWLRQHNITTGVLYFGDDDNTYDLKLFSEIRDTKHVSMFPVGLIGYFGISGPVVRKGKVIGFLDSWVVGRHWPVDMAGFAVSLSYMAEHPNASMPFKLGCEEDLFLRSIGLNLDMIEPKANNCTEVLVWHTQTKNDERNKVKIDHEYLDERSNLGALFKALTEMGVSSAADDEGSKAIISKNGRAERLSYFLSSDFFSLRQFIQNIFSV